MKPIQFQTSTILLTRVDETKLEEAQRIFDRNAAYHNTILHQKPDNMAQRCLNAPLPSVKAGRVFKYFMLVTAKNISQTPLGILDIFVGFPNYKVTTLASLLVQENYQRKGIGTETLFALREFLNDIHPAVEYLTASVTDNNVPALRFFHKNKFERTDSWTKFENNGNTLTAVMFKKNLNSLKDLQMNP